MTTKNITVTQKTSYMLPIGTIAPEFELYSIFLIQEAYES